MARAGTGSWTSSAIRPLNPRRRRERSCFAEQCPSMSERFKSANTELLELLEQFESAVFAQEPVAADSYDRSYFVEGWRCHDNRYDVETRRRIEDRNPRLITEVFEPERVLDVGCGPGFLMLFLHELGVDVHGIDFAPASKDRKSVV